MCDEYEVKTRDTDRSSEKQMSQEGGGGEGAIA